MQKSLIILAIIAISALADTTQNAELTSKYSINVLRKGDGVNYPNKGDQVRVHYVGTFKDGNVFDSSRNRGTPFSFQVGVGQVIKGWDEIVMGMSLGEKVDTLIPSAFAYGSRGAGRAIPPNTDLKFEIELLGFGDKNANTEL